MHTRSKSENMGALIYGIVLITVCFELMTVSAAAYIYRVPAVRMPAPIPSAAMQQQYHTQDIYGQYAYGYSGPLSSKQEMRTADGVTRGTYSYVDADDKVQTVRYIADAGGFRVMATNLPVMNLTPPQPVTDTPEVAAARAQHLAAHRDQLVRNTAAQHALLPHPVEDTVEVAAAKAEFFKRYEEEKLRHKLIREHNAALQAAIASPNEIAFDVLVPERAYLPVIA